MRIAIPYDREAVFQHFGHTAQFKLYDTENGRVTSSRIVVTDGRGHSALVDFLILHRVDILICGGIGKDAQNALAESGIKLFGGVCGTADKAASDFLAGTLVFDPSPHCGHHTHDSEIHTESTHGHGCHEKERICEHTERP